jgi:hypothetical protein
MNMSLKRLIVRVLARDILFLGRSKHVQESYAIKCIPISKSSIDTRRRDFSLASDPGDGGPLQAMLFQHGERSRDQFCQRLTTPLLLRHQKSFRHGKSINRPLALKRMR